jgi:hypothetical protein
MEKKKEIRMIEVGEDELQFLYEFIKKQPIEVALQAFGVIQAIVQRDQAKQQEEEKPAPNRATRRKLKKTE